MRGSCYPWGRFPGADLAVLATGEAGSGAIGCITESRVAQTVLDSQRDSNDARPWPTQTVLHALALNYVSPA